MARKALRAIGSPQQDAPGRPSTQRIGNRPDLLALVKAAGIVVVRASAVKKPAKKIAVKTKKAAAKTNKAAAKRIKLPRGRASPRMRAPSSA